MMFYGTLGTTELWRLDISTYILGQNSIHTLLLSRGECCYFWRLLASLWIAFAGMPWVGVLLVSSPKLHECTGVDLNGQLVWPHLECRWHFFLGRSVLNCFSFSKHQTKTFGLLCLAYRYVWLFQMSEVLSSGSFPFQEVSVDTICISTLFITEQPEKSLGQVRKAPQSQSNFWKTGLTRYQWFIFLFLEMWVLIRRGLQNMEVFYLEHFVRSCEQKVSGGFPLSVHLSC